MEKEKLKENEDKEFVESMYFILPGLTEHTWRVILGLIQGRVISKVDQALLSQREEILKSIETLEQVENKVEVFEVIKLIQDYGKHI